MPVDYNQMIQNLQQAQNQSNKANEQRYKQLVGNWNPQTQTFDGGLIAGLGQQQESQIEETGQRRQATLQQQLINRGLGNTSVLAAASRGIDKDVGQMRQNLLEQISGIQAGIVERREDVGPSDSSIAQIAGLAQQAEANKTPKQNIKIGASSAKMYGANSGSSWRATPTPSTSPSTGGHAYTISGS